MTRKSFYKILQVDRHAANEVISSAYRTLMSKLKKHPDLGGNFEEAQAINEAYETLSDPAKRAAYDMEKCVELRSNEKENRQERRRVPRKNVDAKVSYCVSDEEIWHFARVKDVSVLGIRLQSKKSFGIGKKLVIVPDNASKAAMHGIVRWQRMFHPSNFERIYEAGIEFFDQIIDVEDRVQA